MLSTRPMRRLAFLLSFVTFAGCAQEVGEFCQTETDCEDGLFCTQNKCSRAPGGFDGSIQPDAPLDAGEPDAATLDALPLDAATLDAAIDALDIDAAAPGFR